MGKGKIRGKMGTRDGEKMRIHRCKKKISGEACLIAPNRPLCLSIFPVPLFS
jgi:hypothetical protein